jgi:hypothetical protein
MKSNKTLVIVSLLAVTSSLLFSSCGKEPVVPAEKSYPSEVLQTWINFDLRLLRANPAVLNNFIMVQQWAYSSIAVYEATLVRRGDHATMTGQLDQMPSMPAATPRISYHSPTITNTVMAAMKRYYYSAIPAADKTSTDSLEAAFNTRYQTEVDAETFQRSVDYGKAVAQSVIDWSKTDGSLTVHPPYVLPVGPGQWERTPTGLLAPQNPFWSSNRTLIPGSIAAAQIPPPPAYSTDPSSPFFAAAKETYDLSQTLTPDQIDQVIFWRDVPGGGHAHWLAIFSQVLNKEGDAAMLDKAVLVYAKMGITQSDARISCWKAKYTYNLLRPVTYIRSVMGKPHGILTSPHPIIRSIHQHIPAFLFLQQLFFQRSLGIITFLETTHMSFLVLKPGTTLHLVTLQKKPVIPGFMVVCTTALRLTVARNWVMQL